VYATSYLFMFEFQVTAGAGVTKLTVPHAPSPPRAVTATSTVGVDAAAAVRTLP
jgi:hypothetical protein